MLKRLFRRWKIRQLTRLLKDLRAQYGKKRYYSKREVERALKRKRLIRSTSHMSANNCYAYAMYCSPQVSARACSTAGVDTSYASMKRDISEVVFGRQREFDMSSLAHAIHADNSSGNSSNSSVHGSDEL
ncbi:DUF6559 family protein [Corallincola luteus]|uniref:DUF6559 family protein n=1 Tax=Corallincola luteus TaxID=1775177 RepID=UPI0030B807C1